jgi:putative nucleotidyltransferase-like protein
MSRAPAPEVPVHAEPSSAALWQAVDRLIDGAASLEDLREHRLELLAARRWRELGRSLPEQLALDEKRSVLRSLAVRPLVSRLREVVDGPMMVLKGPEIAAFYPAPTARPFNDVDLLVHDAAASQRALLAAGFQEIADPELYRDIHHLRPLWSPSFPLTVELHTRPKWLDSSRPPSLDELLERAIPSSTEVDGVVAPSRADHAVLVAVHSWAHEPFRSAGELVDVAALCAGLRGEEVEAVAAEHDVKRLWVTTARVVDAMLRERRATSLVRTWSGNIVGIRRRTVLENHLMQVLSPFGTMPRTRALGLALRKLPSELVPKGDERWRRKLRRSARSLLNARTPRSVHDTELEERDLL